MKLPTAAPMVMHMTIPMSTPMTIPVSGGLQRA